MYVVLEREGKQAFAIFLKYCRIEIYLIYPYFFCCLLWFVRFMLIFSPYAMSCMSVIYILLSCTQKGGLTLSFFERRATRQLFGLVSNEERVM